MNNERHNKTKSKNDQIVKTSEGLEKYLDNLKL